MDKDIPCPQCGYETHPDNNYCGHCGISLTRSKQLVPRRANSPTAVFRALPARLSPTGKILAMGLAALAAEAGLFWLGRRVESANRYTLPAARDSNSKVTANIISQSLEEVSIWLQEGDYQSHLFAHRVVQSLRSTKPTEEKVNRSLYP